VGDALERLIALAGTTKVEAYTRHSKTGKAVHVESYLRTVRNMPDADLLKEYRSLTGGQSDLPATTRRSRLATVVGEIRRRKPFGKTGSGVGKGTADDPVNVKGDVVLAAKLLSQGKHVRLNHIDKVGTLLDELTKMVEEARAKGKDAPVFDLCKVSVPKTNLFCAESKGVHRTKMPQLGGVEDQFRDELKSLGVGLENKTLPAFFLKATQAELDGKKIAEMTTAMEAGKIADKTVFITKDGYILDGHHRWAAKVAIDAKDGRLGGITMPVQMLDMEIGEALDFATDFARRVGKKPKGLGSAADGDLLPGKK
jgi:hypothetical protein